MWIYITYLVLYKSVYYYYYLYKTLATQCNCSATECKTTKMYSEKATCHDTLYHPSLVVPACKACCCHCSFTKHINNSLLCILEHSVTSITVFCKWWRTGMFPNKFTRKLKYLGYCVMILMIFSHFGILACDRWMDRQRATAYTMLAL